MGASWDGDVRGAIDALQPVPLSSFRLAAGGRQVSLELPGGVAVSRWGMDAALAQAATESGASFLQETTAVIGPVVGIAIRLAVDWRHRHNGDAR